MLKKLTSRKLWLSIIGFATPLALAFGIAPELIDQAQALILAALPLIAYIIGQSAVDCAQAKKSEKHATEEALSAFSHLQAERSVAADYGERGEV